MNKTKSIESLLYITITPPKDCTNPSSATTNPSSQRHLSLSWTTGGGHLPPTTATGPDGHGWSPASSRGRAGRGRRGPLAGDPVLVAADRGRVWRRGRLGVLQALLEVDLPQPLDLLLQRLLMSCANTRTERPGQILVASGSLRVGTPSSSWQSCMHAAPN